MKQALIWLFRRKVFNSGIYPNFLKVIRISLPMVDYHQISDNNETFVILH